MTIFVPAPTQSDALAALRSFLLAVLPNGTEVIQAQLNRVPEPKGKNFVVMTPVRQERIGTNEDTYTDAVGIGSISGTTMTISALADGSPAGFSVGNIVFGAGVTTGTKIVSQTSGVAGGVGIYVVTPSQGVASRALAAGTEQIQQSLKVAVQMDFHSEPITVAGDMAATVTTLMRDAYAVEQFANQSPARGVVPLYAEDPRQLPFINDQQQYESRWVVEALLQANVVVSVPQQFADLAGVELISVDAEYAP